MVPDDLLSNIHLIFGSQGNKPFSGLTVITIGDFFPTAINTNQTSIYALWICLEKFSTTLEAI